MGAAKNAEKRKPTIVEAFSSVILLFIMIVISATFGVSVVPILILGTTIVCLIGKRCGYTWKELEEGMVSRISGVVGMMSILVCIGFMMSSWMFSGTIPVLIYYLAQIINPKLIVVMSFILCGVVSIAIGTSYGTAATIGVVMIGLAQTLGVSMPAVAGAVICASHIGNHLSPMADMVILASSVGETSLIPMLKRTCYFVIPSLLLCVIIYAALGFNVDITNASTENITFLTDSIANVFNTNPLVIAPMIIMLILCVFKVAVMPAMLVSSISAIIIGVTFNGFPLMHGIASMYSGFDLSSVTSIDIASLAPEVPKLVNRGGMTSMGSTIVTLFVAMSYAGVMVKIGSIDVIVEALFSKVNSAVGLAVSTVSISLVTAMATVSSYLTLIMPCELLKKKYIENGYHPINIAAIAQSVGSPIMCAIPWSATAVYMKGITGVDPLLAAPFSVYSWITCIVAIITVALGFGVKKINDDEKSAFLAEYDESAK